MRQEGAGTHTSFELHSAELKRQFFKPHHKFVHFDVPLTHKHELQSLSDKRVFSKRVQSKTSSDKTKKKSLQLLFQICDTLYNFWEVYIEKMRDMKVRMEVSENPIDEVTLIMDSHNYIILQKYLTYFTITPSSIFWTNAIVICDRVDAGTKILTRSRSTFIDIYLAVISPKSYKEIKKI